MLAPSRRPPPPAQATAMPSLSCAAVRKHSTLSLGSSTDLRMTQSSELHSDCALWQLLSDSEDTFEARRQWTARWQYEAYDEALSTQTQITTART
jgi:hypothetical protein